MQHEYMKYDPEEKTKSKPGEDDTMSEKLRENVQMLFSQEREEDLRLLNEKTAELACAQLAEKYGETFAAAAIGNRLNMNSTTILAYPEKEPDLIFYRQDGHGRQDAG